MRKIYFRVLIVFFMIIGLGNTSVDQGQLPFSGNTSGNSTNSSQINSGATPAQYTSVEPAAAKRWIFEIDTYTNSIETGNIMSFATKTMKNTTPFAIKGYTRPTKEGIYKNQSFLNAATLSRAVERTPHGHVSYYN